MATAAAEGGGPAAALPWEDGTILERLLRQLEDIGVARTYVIARPEWEAQLRESVARVENATLETSASPSEDFARSAEIARERGAGLIVTPGELVTQREALAGLLAHPGVVNGVLGTSGRLGSPYAFRARTARGRVVSAASAYHAVAAPRGSFLGVLKIAAANNETFVAITQELSELTRDGLPEGWPVELERTQELWRLTLGRAALKAERRAARDALEAAGRARDELPPMEPEAWARRKRELARALAPEEELELGLRFEAAKQDAVSMMLVGLIRRSVHIANLSLRGYFWARPLSRAAIEEAAVAIQEHDEEQIRLKVAVKGADGFFTTFFVSTWSRYLARWTARRGIKPNQVTVAALCVGLAAAAAFATGEQAGYVAGAVLLYFSFVLDCVDGQLARYSRLFSKFGAYLDSVFDRTKEYAAFAGLAIGASSSEVWILAGAMLTLQIARHSFDFSFGATDRQTIAETPQPPLAQAPDEALARNRMKSNGTLEAKLGALEFSAATAAELREAADDAEGNGGAEAGEAQPRSLPRRILGVWRLLDRVPGLIWIKKMAAFPIGERFAVICVTAPLFGPRTTFIVLLAWGGFALLYTSTGRTLRTLAKWRTVGQ
jgi:hypothetical protein